MSETPKQGKGVNLEALCQKVEEALTASQSELEEAFNYAIDTFETAGLEPLPYRAELEVEFEEDEEAEYAYIQVFIEPESGEAAFVMLYPGSTQAHVFTETQALAEGDTTPSELKKSILEELGKMAN